jgi:hypothetical protein
MADPRFDLAPLLQRAADLSLAYLASLPSRHVGPRATSAAIAERLRVALPQGPEDPVVVIERMARDLDAGLVASAGPRYYGVERADSWSTDSHKWLNVGYDSGFVATRDPAAHRAAMAASAP